MASKNQEAAEKAVRKSQQVNKAERTTEQIIADIGKLAASGLSVTSADILVLLSHYRAALNIIAELGQRVLKLTVKYDEFRAVYEQENHSKLFVMPEKDAPAFIEAMEAATPVD